MKKAALIVIVVLVLAAVALAFIGRSEAPAAAMGAIGMKEPGVAAGLVASVRAHFTTGKAEIQRALETKKTAKSFRMKTLLSLHPGRPLETVTEVSCPDRERFTTTIGERAFHAVRIGGKAYVEQQDGKWTVQETQPSGWSPCGADPGEPAPWAVMNEGRDPSIVLASLISHTEVTRGAFVSTNAGSCQQWILNLKMPGGVAHGHGAGGLRYTICIDPGRHLPVAVSMGNGGLVTTYYDWNQSIAIEAPKM